MLSGPAIILTLVLESTTNPGRFDTVQQPHETMASCQAAQAVIAILLQAEVVVKGKECARER